MSDHPLATLQTLASEQEGLITIAQARNEGVSDAQVKRLVSADLVERPYRGVLRLAATPRTWRQDLLATQMRAGTEAVAVRRSAARLYELEGSERWPIELGVPVGQRPRGLAVPVFESGDLFGGDVTRLGAIRVTTPTRTLVDLGASVSPEALEVALDDALRRRLTAGPLLQDALARLAGRGRSGPNMLRALFDERDLLDGITDTGFETRMLRLLRAADLPTPVLQHRVVGPDGKFVTRLDLAYPDVLIGIEADSERWHMNRQRFQNDRAKRAVAESLGWTILAFTHHHVTRRPEFVAETIRRTLARTGKLHALPGA